MDMDTSRWYNGYNWNERIAKLKAGKKLIASGELRPATGPCDLCGDPNVPVEHHDEDYSKPYLWHPPALLCLCRHCHRTKLHKRFSQPQAWFTFLAHVRRGGYASDLQIPEIKKELQTFNKTTVNGQRIGLRILRPYAATLGSEWFATLSIDAVTMASPSSRPRP